MYVIKRNGKKEQVQLDKVTERIRKLAYNIKVEPIVVAQKVVSSIYDGIPTTEIDKLASETAALLALDHPDYSKLASRISVSNLHKETSDFYSTMKKLYKSGYLAEDFIKIVRQHGKDLEKVIDYDRDFDFEYFGFKTLERSYLSKVDGKIVERPQHMYMRVAIGVIGNNYDKIVELYHLLSRGYYTHATPTLFNAGTKRPQLSSCFLIANDDSIEGIYDTLKDCALISKSAGGIGLHTHTVRAAGSHIKGTNGTSNGIIPMLKVFNETARYVDQGGGKRKGSIAVYLEPWHADIFEFLDLKKNTGKEEFRARDLFLALWIPDLFMKRVKEDGNWTLLCPHECPGLSDVYGEEFEKLYTKYEEEGKGRETIKARQLMGHIIESQMETGVPYMLYKDACNIKSNQKNLGVIKSSNLCLSGDTKVDILIAGKEESMKLKDLIDLHKESKEEIKVKSYNTTEKVIEYKKVQNAAMTNPNAKVMKITDDSTGKYIICTPDHKVWTKNRGYVEAKNLTREDELEIS